MKQIHLVIYLESKNCEIVRHDKNGSYYVMRNLSNKKFHGVPKPKDGSDNLNEESIVLICRRLEVDPPPTCSPDIEEFIDKIQEDMKKRFPSS